MKGVIYLIKTADGLYVGSTTRFNRRKLEHKKNMEKFPDRLVYKNIISNNGIYKIEIYCNVNCRDRRHLDFFEEQYRIILGADLNMIKAFTPENEPRVYHKNPAYHIKNKERNNNNSKEYRKINKEKISNQKSIKHNCMCGGKYTQQHKASHFKSKIHLKYIKDSQAPPL